MMKYETILFQRTPPRATITLNRPDVLNAINETMMLELQDTVRKVALDRNVKVLVVDSACERAFGAGIDVAWVKNTRKATAGRELRRTFGAFRYLEKPIIAAIDGLCLGASLELAISCDFLIATERSQFGLPNINRGIPTTVEAAILTHALSIFDVKELCYTGDFWDAARAERRGLLTRLVPNDGLSAEVDAWVAKLSEKTAVVLAAEKDIINKWMTTDLETSMEYSLRVVEAVWSTKDMEEGVSAFVQKRKPKFEGR
jgi:enoyl-CoA hydratase